MTPQHTRSVCLCSVRILHTTILARSLASGTTTAERSGASLTRANGAIPFVRAVKAPTESRL